LQSGKEADPEGSGLHARRSSVQMGTPWEQGTALQLLSAMQMLPVPGQVPVAASLCGECLAPVQRQRLPPNTHGRSGESCFSKTRTLWYCWLSKRDATAQCHLLRSPEDRLFL